ncbi:hypothetical protein [Dactylosporangium sp. CA-139066]|uniref:hypothetical protein n=1 Tax=Dactylosporangium sp. CA-139066 TaxID=3239930 RepID=UPI003D92BE03
MPTQTVTLDPAAAWLIDRTAGGPAPAVVLGAGTVPPGALRLLVTPGSLGAGRPLVVHGDTATGTPTLRVLAPDLVPAVAAVLLAVRDRTGRVPRLSCTWPARRALSEVVSLIDPAVFSVPRLRNLLRRAEPSPARRPLVCADLP